MVFVVPQLRNVSRTAPYYHDGSVETLEEAVELMGRHQLGEELAPEDVEDVVAFLRALEGDPEEALRVDPFAR
jgi:cytochrome c peroxidase